MLSKNFSAPSVFIALILVALTTFLAVYVTPLRWFPIIEPTVKDIDSRSFYENYTRTPEKYLFIDVRPESAYSAAHAVGSINMPLHTLYDARHTLPKSGKEIILICSGGRASGVGYSYLEHYGFLNIHRIEGGIENWMLAGLPVEGTGVTPSQY
jgi:rhodanese-related sulfurtransferase